MSREPLIVLENVSRYYGDVCAVDGLSFSVCRGEVLGLLGPNGAGKTTTMQMICGILPLSSGQITVAGNDVLLNPRQAKSRLGYLPEQPPLFPDLTVAEYLNYCGKIKNVPKTALSTSVANSMARCGLSAVKNRLIDHLSKGYRQRVGIAQAIIHAPDMIIFDEPTVGLDPNQIVEIRRLISELGNDHGVILSTHVLSEVQNMCSRVLIINQGRLVLDAEIDALAESTGLRAVIVALREPPVVEEIHAIDGIVQAEPLDGERFMIKYHAEKDVPTALAQISADRRWGLYELIPQAEPLEQVFMQLTRGE